MKFKGTWILLIVALAAVAYLVLIEQPKHERKQRDEEAELMLARFDAASVQRASIESAGKSAIELVRLNDAWRLIAPVDDGADEATINTLITSILGAEIERTIDPDPDLLDEFGLNETATRLALMTAEGDTVFSLIIGDHTLTKSHFYAMKDARSDVLLLPATVRRYAVKDVSDFRDKRVVDFKLEDVTMYRLASDSKTLAWELHPDRGWITIQAGDTIAGDRQEVEAIIRTLRGMRVRSFVSDDPRDFDRYWEPPHNTLSIWIAGAPEPLELRCGHAEEGEFFAKRDDADRIVKLDGIFLESFEKTVDDLRDKRLLSFSREEIATITIQAPDTGGTLVRSGTGWAFPNPALGAIEEAAAASLLSLLEYLKYDTALQNAPPDLERFGFDDPSFRILLLDAEGTQIDRMLAGSRDTESGSRYVTSSSTGLLGLIDEQKLDAIVTSFRRSVTR